MARKFEFFKRRLLEERRKTLTGNVEEENEELDVDKGGISDIADEASASNERRLLSSLSINDSQILSQIEAALEKIENGSYGKCEKCGKPIPQGRLEVLPYATHCVPCKEAEESASRRI